MHLFFLYAKINNIYINNIIYLSQVLLHQVLLFLLSPSMIWVYTTFILLIIICFVLSYSPQSKISITLELIFEKGYIFFEEIVGKESKKILPYIVSLFFLLLIINLLGVVSDFIAPILGFSPEWEFVLSQYFQTPSADLSFNLAVALVSMILLLWVQFSHFGFKKAIYSYVPIFGKWYLSYTAGKKNAKMYLIFYPLVKFFDIVLSLFLSFLDIVGLFAKVVSLSFRLFGNIASGWVLLILLFWALNDFTQKISTFMGGINFPVIFPLILYAQSTLVACIQAMVFALLVAIFIRVSQLEASQ